LAAWELFPKEWTATHDGYVIRVHNSWNGGMQLYVDDHLCASTTKLFSLDRRAPVLRHEFGAATVIEVFVHAFVTVKAKILVNGTQVAGESF